MFVLSEDNFNIKFNVFRKWDEPEVIEPFSHINFIAVKRYNAYCIPTNTMYWIALTLTHKSMETQSINIW